jgi:N-acetylneuraminic acid mutarotase
MAASWRGRLYVVGGYGEGTGRLRSAFVLDGDEWKRLPDLPYVLAAGGAAVVGNTLYVVGGVAGPQDRSVLVRRALALDLARAGARWRFVPGPTGREHLGVAATGGRIYAVGGRSAGLDTNTRLAETWRPGERRWTRLPPVPDARGGTGLGAGGGKLVSAGGEKPTGTIPTVYSYDIAQRRWTKLPDLPTPRHGLGVSILDGRAYVIAGGRVPGFAVSDVVEIIELE